MEKKKIYLIIGICAILILALGLTTAWFTWSSQTNTDVTFTVSGLNITSSNTNITGTLYPTADKNNGLVEEFTVVQNNTMSTPVCGDFTLTLTTFPTELKHESFKYKLYNGNTLVGSGNFASSNQGDVMTIATGQAIISSVSTYKLYIWIDGANYNNPLSMGGKTFLFNLGITANQQDTMCNPSVILDESGANVPELVDGMIPIKYDGTKWVKASTTSTNDWYNYSDKEWANAVMVSSSSRTNYMNAAVGTEVLESDILAYYVWIPRYKYQLFNVGTESGGGGIPKLSSYNNSLNKTTALFMDLPSSITNPIEIQVQFESGTPTKSNGTTNGKWLTHPAFTFGTDELTGIWVGKFSTTGDATTPTIKPNIQPLVNQNVSTQFTTSQKFGTSNYLTTNGVNDTDAHMMKNTEWGAVAYLKQSKYGLGLTDIGWNNYYDGNDDSLKTGCGAISGTSYGTTCNAYNTTDGMKASTTGNVYGVYDMSAVMGTYVMGVMKTSDGTALTYSSSDFTTSTLPFNSKYVDQYEYGTTYSDQTAYNRRILGDATGEVNGWYDDLAYFVGSGGPWFIRGSLISDVPAVAGVFSFYGYVGRPVPGLVFRSVLAPGATATVTPDS